MNNKTRSENLFEAFFESNGIVFDRVPVISNVPGAYRPDYRAVIGSTQVYFEVKELAENQDFQFPPKGEFRVYSTVVGDHLRRLIARSKKQIQYGACQGMPSVLVVYNNMDPFQLIGTDRHDFVTAMYGAYSIDINRNTGKHSNMYFGKGKKFTEEMNTSFTALAHLCDRNNALTLTLYENCFAKLALPYDSLPPAISVVRFVSE